MQVYDFFCSHWLKWWNEHMLMKTQEKNAILWLEPTTNL